MGSFQDPSDRLQEVHKSLTCTEVDDIYVLYAVFTVLVKLNEQTHAHCVQDHVQKVQTDQGDAEDVVAVC